jgi:hypothetical protein
MVGGLWRLRESTVRGPSILPEGTLLLIVSEVRVGLKGSVDYFVMHSGITERIPDYWPGWSVIDEAR